MVDSSVAAPYAVQFTACGRRSFNVTTTGLTRKSEQQTIGLINAAVQHRYFLDSSGSHIWWRQDEEYQHRESFLASPFRDFLRRRTGCRV